MRTKYIATHSGFFAIFNEGIGLEHVHMADHVDDARNSRDAGFVDAVDGELGVYGQSISLAVRANKATGDLMNEALEKGEMRLYPFREFDWIATNAHLPGDFEVATSVDDLIKKRIIRE